MSMNPGTLVIVNLLGGVALLLWGLRMVRTGILRAWGDWLKRYIEARLSNELSAFGAGLAATMLLQSGTATSLLVTGLAASGMIPAATGLAVLLGGDLGSAIVTALFTYAGPLVAHLSPLLLFAGYILFSSSTAFRPRNGGRILMGLGLMLLALHLVVTATVPLREASLFHEVLASLNGEPLLAVIIGAAATWASYSTLSVILLIASFLTNGSLELPAAMALALGVNLGGGFPALTAAMGQPREARRVPLVNVVRRSLLAFALIPVLPYISDFGARWSPDPVSAVLGLHVAFNGILVLLCLPLAGSMIALSKKLFPEISEQPDQLAQPRYLDPAVLDTASLALSNAEAETVRMTELLDRMVGTCLQTLKGGPVEDLKGLRLLDGRINAYQAAIQGYIARLMELGLDASDNRRAMEIMLYVSNLEHAGDVVHLNLNDRIRTKIKEQVEFSARQTEVLTELGDLVRTSLRIAAGVLSSGDVAGARRLIAQKAAFRARENRMIEEHFSDYSQLTARSARGSALFIDIIRDLHRLNSHIVSAAYPIVDREGLLRETRLRDTASVAEQSSN